MNKDFRIWGVSYGLIGDLVMSLPTLTYFEKKYPGSYKYWAIQKKCSQCAPIFINHPLIDRIHVIDGWEHMSQTEVDFAKQCDIYISEHQSHPTPEWFNKYSCVEETARLAGIFDLKDVLTADEMIPRLVKWFPPGAFKSSNTGYSNVFDSSGIKEMSGVGIWPVAGYGKDCKKRSPSTEWSSGLVKRLVERGSKVYHFGYMTEPDLHDNKNLYIKYTDLPFFEQIRLSCSTDICVGTDSGSMWVLGAYGHPCVHLMTYWMTNHVTNPYALCPVNHNAKTLFNPTSIDNIDLNTVVDLIEDVRQKMKCRAQL